MTANPASRNRTRSAWWTRLFRSVGAAAGLLTAAAGAGTTSAAAQGGDYRSAAAAPVAWQQFATQLQGRFQQRLAADDEAARRLQDYMARRAAGAEAAAPFTLPVRAWVLPDGQIERIEFDGFDDDAAAVNLRSILASADAGVPPPDMLQPLHLRLSLRPKDQPRTGK